MMNTERLEEIRARLAALEVDDQKWARIIAFAIDAPLLFDERFAPNLHSFAMRRATSAICSNCWSAWR